MCRASTAMHSLSATSHFILSHRNSCACIIILTNAPFPSEHRVFMVHVATLTWFKSFKLHLNHQLRFSYFSFGATLPKLP